MIAEGYEKGLVILVAKKLKDVTNHSSKLAKVFLHYSTYYFIGKKVNASFYVNVSRYSEAINEFCFPHRQKNL